jgi:hypothetical protein
MASENCLISSGCYDLSLCPPNGSSWRKLIQPPCSWFLLLKLGLKSLPWHPSHTHTCHSWSFCFHGEQSTNKTSTKCPMVGCALSSSCCTLVTHVQLCLAFLCLLKGRRQWAVGMERNRDRCCLCFPFSFLLALNVYLISRTEIPALKMCDSHQCHSLLLMTYWDGKTSPLVVFSSRQNSPDR